MAARLALLVTAALVGCAGLLDAQGHPEDAIGGASVWAAALQLAAGLGACAAGADLALRRSLALPGTLLAAGGLALLLGSAPLPGSAGAALFSAALLLGAFAPVLAGSAAVCTPVAGRLGALLVTVTLAAIATFGLLETATFDPSAAGCFECPRNLLLFHGAPSLRSALLDAEPAVLSALCAVLAAV